MRMDMGRQALMVVAALGLGAFAGAGTPTAQNDVRTGGIARRGGRGGGNR